MLFLDEKDYGARGRPSKNINLARQKQLPSISRRPPLSSLLSSRPKESERWGIGGCDTSLILPHTQTYIQTSIFTLSHLADPRHHLRGHRQSGDEIGQGGLAVMVSDEDGGLSQRERAQLYDQVAHRAFYLVIVLCLQLA